MSSVEHEQCEEEALQGGKKPQGVKKPATRHVHIPQDQYGMYGVHVSGFSSDTTEHDLRELFQSAGEVRVCKIVATKNPHEMQCIAFIKFKTPEEAYQALEKFDGYNAGNWTLFVRPAFVSEKYKNQRGTGPWQKKIAKNSGNGPDRELKEVNNQNRNSRRQPTRQNHSNDVMSGTSTDYHFREELPGNKNASNVNTVLGQQKNPDLTAGCEGQRRQDKHEKGDTLNEMPQGASSHPSHGYHGKVLQAPTRGLHNVQHREGPCQASRPNQTIRPCQTSPPHKSSPGTQTAMPPAMIMSSSGTPVSAPNTYIWSQGSFPAQNGNSFTDGSTQNGNSAFNSYRQRQFFSGQDPGSTAGVNMATVASSLSHLRISGAISPIQSLNRSKDVSLWSTKEVADFIRSSECPNYADFFQDQDIDGKALLLLERDTLLHFMKVGPALKLLQVIDRLKSSQATSPLSLHQRHGCNGW